MPPRRPPKRSLRPVLVFALAASACAAASALSPTLPEIVPELGGWERIAARATLQNPARSVDYEFYVRPGREATYEVIRYRVTFRDQREARRRTDESYERLQWDLDGRRLRRFELVPGSPQAHWEELAAGTQRFSRETATILELLGQHRKLLGLGERFP
jgi:hypothetical protein